VRTHRIQPALLLAALASASACSTAAGPDPWRGYNEPVFHFNDALDRHLLGPVARGWDWLAPEFVLTGVDNFFRNLDMPRTFANDVLQLKPAHAANDIWRFVLNSSVGVAGLVDVASMLGLQDNREDFGQTLGYWGTPAGPYFVMPVLPFRSTVRDWIAYPIDLAFDPTLWIGMFAVRYLYGPGIVDVVNRRAINNEQIEENRREAIDWYVFVRDAALQNREGAVHGDQNETKKAQKEEDLYDIEE
jgi:phospholipid-binding lipoprotein MlaA